MSPKIFYRADHVGSLLRPPELLDARQRLADGDLDPGGLKVIEDDAIIDAVRLQEAAGLEIISDGEFRRDVFWKDFISKVSGTEICSAANTNIAVGAAKFAHAPKHVRVIDRLARPKPITVEDYRVVKAFTDRAVKITLPTPTRFNIMDGPAWINQDAYPDSDAMWSDIIDIYRREIADLEDAGCRYIQIDEPYLAFFVDDARRKTMEDVHAKSCNALLDEYVDIINESVATRCANTYLTLHICRGNSESTWYAAGGYERISRAISGLAVDALLLEYDDARSGGFEPLRAVPETCKVVLGLVSSKFPELESHELLKRRVTEASVYVAMENLALSPQCGFASTSKGNNITEAEQTAKLRLVVEAACEMWG